MKKLVYIAALCSVSFFNAQKFEVSAGYGTGSLFGGADSILKAVGTTVFNGEPEMPVSNGVLTIALTTYNENMKWRYGLEANLESFDETKSSYRKQSYFSVLPKVDYFWSDANNKWRFYSGVSVGVLFRDLDYVDTSKNVQKTNDTFLAFNIMPIGVRYGGDFGVFIEPSIGTRGFVQGGLNYIF